MPYSTKAPSSNDRSILSEAARAIGGEVLRSEITCAAISTSQSFGTIAAGEISVTIEIGQDVSCVATVQLFDALVEQARRSFLEFLVEDRVQ